ASCQEEALLARTLTEAVQRACKETAPEDLKLQVMAKLRAAQALHSA
ncbi:MAG: alpha-ketoglutarate decarboxylase, partial [Mycetocola sp.]